MIRVKGNGSHFCGEYNRKWKDWRNEDDEYIADGIVYFNVETNLVHILCDINFMWFVIQDVYVTSEPSKM